MMVVTALCVAVWWCLMAPLASRAMLVVLSSPPAVLSLCGGCALFTVWFPLDLGWVRFWPAAPVSCEVCSISCPSWLVLLLSICPLPALAGQVVWTQSCGPSCYSCVLSSRGVSGAAFCRLGLLSHPLLQWPSLDGSYSLVVQAPGVFLDSLLGFFPLASSVC